MAEPTPGRPGGAQAGPASATAATFQVNDKSLKDLHNTWRILIKDVKEFNAELKKIDGSKLAQLGAAGGSGSGGRVGGRMPGMPPVPVHLGSTIPVGSSTFQPPQPGQGGVPNGPPGGGGGGTPKLAGGANPWVRGAQAVAAVAGAASLFYARRMDDITDADLYFNQQGQNTGYGYRHDEKGHARNALFGRPGGAGYGGGVRGYQSVQDLLGGARTVFSATGGSVGSTNNRGMYANGRGMDQLRAAGQLSILTPDMGLQGSATAVASLYDPTMSARMASMGVGPSVGMRGQLQSPQAIYQNILQRVYGGKRPTAQMITEGLQPGANLYVTLTQGLGLGPEAIEQFSRYAIAQANLGGNARDVNRAIDYASRGTSGAHLSKSQVALVKRAGLDDNIRQRRNELGGAQARQTIEAGREGEGALMAGFGKLAEMTDALTNSFKRLNDATGGASGGALGTAGVFGGGISSALNAVGGVGGGIFAYQGLRQMLGRGGGGPGGFGGGGGPGGPGPRGGLPPGAMSKLGRFAAAAGVGYGVHKGMDAAGNWMAKVSGQEKGERANWWQKTGHFAWDVADKAVSGAAAGFVAGGAGGALAGLVGGTALGVGQNTTQLIRQGGDYGKYAEGGVIPGDHHNDTVDIRATPGEVVVPRGVVTRHGGPAALMRALGFGGVGPHGKYAGGGEVTGDTKGLNPEFVKRLKAWSAFVGQPFNVGSGYRSIAEQKVLYDRWMRRVPGQAKAAKPGSSNHNYGLAADGPHWRNKNPEKFGLRYPMDFEPWHVEPMNAKAMRAGGTGATDIDTSVSDGTPPSSNPAGNSTYITAPRAASDEKSAFAAWMSGGAMYGVAQPPSATTPSGKSSGTDSTQPTATTGTAPSDPSGNVKLGQSKAAARGWTGSEWDALYNLFQKESGWRTDAANGSSSARGIAQTMMSVHFGKDWKTSKDALDFMRSPGRQIDWGMNYIAQRYTTPSKAWAHSQKFNWYDVGSWQTENETAVLHKDEMVVPANHARKLRSLVNQQRNQAAIVQPTMTTSAGNQRPIQISLSMPIQLVGKATPDDARALVGMVVSHMQENEELAKMGSGT